ncbi:MAG TPA: dockerin type I domain-containing protein [Phycisphaerae bacterium]|nr:dockerin type I domain-containing protein [Phycisphaerae bacterium]
MLTDQVWYQITPATGFAVAPFTLDVCTLFGDANGSGRVTTADYAEVKGHMGEYTDGRCDLNGSDRVTTADYNVVKDHMGDRRPAKP